MSVRFDPTPNPNAGKFTVGQPVGGPGTFLPGSRPEEEFVASLLGVDGVTSVFLTADFVTISKTPTASWDDIVTEATAILEARFSATDS